MINESTFEGLLPTDPLMVPPWFGCLQWAMTSDEILAKFRADTGNQWRPARNGIDQMVDEACGADSAFFREFAKWMNENLWGSLGIIAGEQADEVQA